MNPQSSSQTLMGMCLLCAIFVLWDSTAFAQNAPAVSRNRELKKIDARATKIEDQFLRNAFDMAREYEQAGDVARAVDYLHAMSLVKPGQPKIEGKLQQLRGEVLAANVFSFEHETSNTWGQPVAFVTQGKPFRIDVQGEYKLAILATVGPNGFAEAKDQSDESEQGELVDDVALGKLMGVIVAEPNQPPKRGKGNRKNGKKIVPFEIGNGRDMRPKQSGYLYLKVNVPLESKPKGALQVQVSGYILAPDGQNVGN